MRQNTKTISTSIAFPFEMLERLERVAHELRLSKSQLVREALMKELPELERQVEEQRRKAATSPSRAATSARS